MTKRKASRDTVRPFSPAVGAARPHGVPTPTSYVSNCSRDGEYTEHCNCDDCLTIVRL